MQILKFGLVGASATATHMLTAGLIYRLAPSLYPFVINVGAFCVALIVSFVGHSRFTFQTDGSIGRFLVAALAGLATNNMVLGLLLWSGAPPLQSIWVATLAAPLVVYLISKFWVFATNE